jgi:hypothetical protein
MQNAPAAEQMVGTFEHLLVLERDMIAAIEALRDRLPRDDRGQLDLLLTAHSDRLPQIEQRVREMGGQPPEPGLRGPTEVPHDATDIATVGDTVNAVRALADDHEALADAYREALTLPMEDEQARRLLEQFASEMEQHGARLAALLPTV